MASDCNQNQFEIDTGGDCLICFKPSCIEGDGALEVKQRVSRAFKMLLRYLGVHVYQLRQYWTGNLKGLNQGGGMEVVDDFHKAQILVSLCKNCSLRTIKFMELFKQFDKIRLELDECTYDLVATSRTEVDGDGGSHVRKRRKVGGGKLEHDSGVAEMLRKEIVEKCSSTLNSSTPRVSLVDLKTTGLLRNNGLSEPDSSKSNHDADDAREDSDVEGGAEGNADALQRKYHDVPVKVEILEKLQEVESGAEFICTECGDCFTKSSRLNSHLVAYHPAKVYGSRLPTNASNDYVQEAVDAILKQQITSSPNKRKREYACPICFHQYKREGTLRAHIINKHVDEVASNIDLKAVIPSKNVSTRRNKKRKSSSTRERKCSTKVVKATDSSVLSCEREDEDGKSSSDSDVEGDNLTSRKNSPPFESGSTRKRKKKRANQADLQSRVLKSLGPAAPRKSRAAVNCVHCGQRFSNRSNLVKHIICNHSLMAFADQLPLNTTELQLQTAIADIIAERRELPNGKETGLRWGCPLCPRNFQEAARLREHTMSCHNDKIVEHVEKQMNNGSLSPTATSRKAARNGKPFLCEHCPKGFVKARLHRTHVMVKHPIQIERIRGKMPPGTSNFAVLAVVRSILKENHTEVEPDKLKYNCSFCSKDFGKASVFKKHLYAFHCDRLSEIISGQVMIESGNEEISDDDGDQTKDYSELEQSANEPRSHAGEAEGLQSEYEDEPEVEEEGSETETMNVSEHDQSEGNADSVDLRETVESGQAEEDVNEGIFNEDEGEDELEEDIAVEEEEGEELESEDEENSDAKMEKDGEQEEQEKEVESVVSDINAMGSGESESEDEEHSDGDKEDKSGQKKHQKEVIPVASGSNSAKGSGQPEPTNDENEVDNDSDVEAEKAEEGEDHDDDVEEAVNEDNDDDVEEEEVEVVDGEDEEEEQPQNENVSLFNGAKRSHEKNNNDGKDTCDQEKSETDSNSITFTSNCEIVMSNLI